jgi:hypothetical protein
MADFDDRSGRDSRLLALVILIAVVVLVVLARFRFPQSESGPAAVTPGPLERLAARATYDDLAGAVHTALQRVEPALVTVTIEPDSESAARTTRGQASAPGWENRFRVAVRLGDDWAVVHVPRGFHLASMGESFAVRDVNQAREIVMFSGPLRSGEDKEPPGLAELAGFAYVCVVEPTPDGPTATPMFIGRVRTLFDERWNDSVLIPGGESTVTPGSLLFQLDGRFLGIVVGHPGGGIAIVPASLLTAAKFDARSRSGGSR